MKNITKIIFGLIVTAIIANGYFHGKNKHPNEHSDGWKNFYYSFEYFFHSDSNISNDVLETDFLEFRDIYQIKTLASMEEFNYSIDNEEGFEKRITSLAKKIKAYPEKEKINLSETVKKFIEFEELNDKNNNRIRIEWLKTNELKIIENAELNQLENELLKNPITKETVNELIYLNQMGYSVFKTSELTSDEKQEMLKSNSDNIIQDIEKQIKTSLYNKVFE